jgi:hypothetical protein
MKKTFAVLWTAAMFAALLIAGCERQEDVEQAPAGVTNEIEAIKYEAANDEFVKSDEQTFADREVGPIDRSGIGKLQEDITPLRFGRFITQITRNITVEIQPGDTIAIAHVEKNIVGNFLIRAINANGDTVLIEKPFNDIATRNVIFKRVQRDRVRYWRNWVPIAVSLIEGGTVPPNNLINLTKTELFLPNGDTITVTDPNSYYLRYRGRPVFIGGRHDVPELRANDPVVLRATLVSSSPDTDMVMFRIGHGLNGRRFRMMLVSEADNGDGTFTRVFETVRGPQAIRVLAAPGFFHAGVDAMTRETLFDDVAPYSVNWWGVPFRVF